MLACTRCHKPILVDRYPRINAQPYCGRACYEKAMRDKGLTR